MGQRKQKTVFTAEPEQLVEISEIVCSGKYKSTSEFLREAIDEKLRRLRRERLIDQVDSYCSEGYPDEDGDLVETQAFDPDKS